MRRWVRVAPRPRALARTERGAAAVEGALVLSAILAPLMLGVLQYGFFFWKLQGVPTLDADVEQSGVVGTYCAGNQTELLTRVEAAALIALANVSDGAGLPVDASDVVATIVSYTPDSLGVDVKVSVTSRVLSESWSLLPLPNDGAVVSDTFLRLQNVRISSTSC